MSLTLATWLARTTALYLTLGLAFAIPFAFGWAARLDPGARGSSVGFRLLLLPGATLLWPWLAARVMRSRPGAGS